MIFWHFLEAQGVPGAMIDIVVPGVWVQIVTRIRHKEKMQLARDLHKETLDAQYHQNEYLAEAVRNRP